MNAHSSKTSMFNIANQLYLQRMRSNSAAIFNKQNLYLIPQGMFEKELLTADKFKFADLSVHWITS